MAIASRQEKTSKSFRFSTRGIRVRSVEKIARCEGDIPSIQSFDMPFDEFFKRYNLIER